jgi:glucose-fructose oxidoreductase
MPMEKGVKKIRYAVVGLGWIAQEAVLPVFGKVDNSELLALVTSDPEKGAKLGDKYRVAEIRGYDGYDDLLRSGVIDAVYIALPNHMHRDYSVRAAQAGIHVLCEKPMADNAADCLAMIHAAEQNNVKLMIAYRLHFEPGNLQAIEITRDGTIGEPRIFSSVFTQQVAEGNVRLKREAGGGPLMDMGVYQINAARYLFRDEPVEVIGAGANSGDRRFQEVHEMATGVLRFPGDRIATFTCSFGAAVADYYQVVGTKGVLSMDPAFDYHSEYKLCVQVDGKESSNSIRKVDQFGAEIEYFSDCIVNSKEPEPSGYEGLADVRIVDALLESMRTGAPVKLEPFEKRNRPDKSQEIKRAAVKPEKLINAQSASAN